MTTAGQSDEFAIPPQELWISLCATDWRATQRVLGVTVSLPWPRIDQRRFFFFSGV
jgi:hypothetical protein